MNYLKYISQFPTSGFFPIFFKTIVYFVLLTSNYSLLLEKDICVILVLFELGWNLFHGIVSGQVLKLFHTEIKSEFWFCSMSIR